MSSSPTSPGMLTENVARPTVIATPGAGTAGALPDGARRGDVRLRLGPRGHRLSLSGRAAGEAHRPPLCTRPGLAPRQPPDRPVQRAPDAARRRQVARPRTPA